MLINYTLENLKGWQFIFLNLLYSIDIQENGNLTLVTFVQFCSECLNSANSFLSTAIQKYEQLFHA